MDPLTEEERRELLRVARESIGAAFGLCAQPTLAVGAPALLSPGAAFVTLHTGPNLRGCVGSVFPREPLHVTVRQMATAALDDSRFRRLGTNEWRDLTIEISRLGPLTPVRPEEIEPGRHGLYVVRGLNRGLLLPQVAARYGWNTIQFLEETCRKAGLPPDAWRDDETQVFAFEAEVFSEADEAQTGDPPAGTSPH